MTWLSRRRRSRRVCWIMGRMMGRRIWRGYRELEKVKSEMLRHSSYHSALFSISMWNIHAAMTTILNPSYYLCVLYRLPKPADPRSPATHTIDRRLTPSIPSHYETCTKLHTSCSQYRDRVIVLLPMLYKSESGARIYWRGYWSSHCRRKCPNIKTTRRETPYSCYQSTSKQHIKLPTTY